MTQLSNSVPGFNGFRMPTTTSIPDEVFDTLMPHLSGSELKALLYICRRTFGFKKHSDNISLNQIANGIVTKDGRVLDSGAGLSKRHAQRAVKTLEEKRIINVVRKIGTDGNNEVNNYSLKFIEYTNLIKQERVGTFCPYPRDTSVPTLETPVSTTRDSKQHITVNGYSNSQKSGTQKDKKKTPGIFDALPTLDQDKDKTAYVKDFLIESLGDKHSAGFYHLVASHVPESVIRQTIAEIKADGAKSPPKVFTNRMKEWAIKKKKKTLGKKF